MKLVVEAGAPPEELAIVRTTATPAAAEKMSPTKASAEPVCMTEIDDKRNTAVDAPKASKRNTAPAAPSRFTRVSKEASRVGGKFMRCRYLSHPGSLSSVGSK